MTRFHSSRGSVLSRDRRRWLVEDVNLASFDPDHFSICPQLERDAVALPRPPLVVFSCNALDVRHVGFRTRWPRESLATSQDQCGLSRGNLREKKRNSKKRSKGRRGEASPSDLARDTGRKRSRGVHSVYPFPSCSTSSLGIDFSFGGRSSQVFSELGQGSDHLNNGAVWSGGSVRKPLGSSPRTAHSFCVLFGTHRRGRAHCAHPSVRNFREMHTVAVYLDDPSLEGTTARAENHPAVP